MGENRLISYVCQPLENLLKISWDPRKNSVVSNVALYRGALYGGSNVFLFLSVKRFDRSQAVLSFHPLKVTWEMFCYKTCIMDPGLPPPSKLYFSIHVYQWLESAILEIFSLFWTGCRGAWCHNFFLKQLLFEIKFVSICKVFQLHKLALVN